MRQDTHRASYDGQCLQLFLIKIPYCTSTMFIETITQLCSAILLLPTLRHRDWHARPNSARTCPTHDFVHLRLVTTTYCYDLKSKNTQIANVLNHRGPKNGLPERDRSFRLFPRLSTLLPPPTGPSSAPLPHYQNGRLGVEISSFGRRVRELELDQKCTAPA